MISLHYSVYQLLLYLIMPQYLDPQQIFPKRLGLMNGNTLVLEYYHLGKDKFKKHLIPYDASKDPKSNVEDIYKNSKHAPYLKRVNPKNVRLVLQGNKIQTQKDKNTTVYDQFPEASKFQEKIQRFTYQTEKQNKPQTTRPEYRQEKPHVPVKHMEAAKPEPILVPPAAQPEDYYEQQFQEFQMSASMDKPNNISSFSKVEPPQSDKNSSLSKSNEPSVQPPKKQKETPIVEEVIEEIEDDFDFLDEDQTKKKKKDKKSKSKDKKSKKEKGEKKSEKKKEVVQNNTVEDEFQFL